MFQSNVPFSSITFFLNLCVPLLPPWFLVNRISFTIIIQPFSGYLVFVLYFGEQLFFSFIFYPARLMHHFPILTYLITQLVLSHSPFSPCFMSFSLFLSALSCYLPSFSCPPYLPSLPLSCLPSLSYATFPFPIMQVVTLRNKFPTFNIHVISTSLTSLLPLRCDLYI